MVQNIKNELNFEEHLTRCLSLVIHHSEVEEIANVLRKINKETEDIDLIDTTEESHD